MRERSYRTEWRHVHIEDPHTGRQRLAYVYPHKIPIANTSWRERVFRGPLSGFDVLILAGALACFILAVVAP